MTFDMITTTAPASQPALSDARSLPGMPADDAAAFDAALSEKLAVIDREASRDWSGQSDRAMPPDWINPVMFSMPAGEIVEPTEIEFATAPVAAEDDTQVADILSGTGDDAEIPADFVPLPFVPQAFVPAAPIDTAAAESESAEVTADNVDESVSGRIVVNGVRPAAATGTPAVVSEQPESEPASIATAPTRTSAPSRIPGDSRPAPDHQITDTADVSETMSDRPASTSTATAAAPSQRKMSAAQASQAWNAAARAVADAARTQTTDAADTQAQSTAATVEATVAAPTTTIVTRASEGSPTQTSGAVADLQSQPSAQDAPMTGDEQPHQGQARQSAEFARFAAALSQVSVEQDDTSRTVVAPPASSQPAPAAAVAPVVAPVAPVEPSMTPGEENVGRLVQAMRINMRQGAWEATVRLNPEHLGDVTIALRVDRNSVSAVVNAEAAGVRQWLETHEQAVRSGMAEHGLQLERFVVQRDGQRRDPQQQEPQPQPRRRQPKAGPDAAERFEIVV